MSEEKKIVVPEPLLKVDDLCKFFRISPECCTESGKSCYL